MAELTSEEVRENIKEVLVNYFDSDGDGDIHGHATDKVMFWVEEYAKSYASIKERAAADVGFEAGIKYGDWNLYDNDGNIPSNKEQFINENYPLLRDNIV